MYFENEDLIKAFNTFGFSTLDLRPSHSEGVYDDSRFFSPKEGLLRGTVFKNEYKSYKDLTYLPIISTNEKEELLLKVYEYDFALNDISLYLDIHPGDEGAFGYFRDCVKGYERSKKEYESRYGSLELNDSVGQVYDWGDNPWPWDKMRGDMYV